MKANNNTRVMEIGKRTFLYENDKILYIIKDVFGANSPDNAVTMEQIIAKGIELGLTKDNQIENWEGYKDGDHPWWPVIAPMMGVGSATAVSENEEPYLHRMKVKKDGKQRKSNVMVYWYDRSHKHEVVRKSNKAKNRKIAERPEEKVVITERRPLTEKEIEERIARNPDKYMLIGNRLFFRDFIKSHPEKFDEATVAMVNS